MEAAAPQFLLETGLPPTRFVFVARPALPAIEGAEYVVNAKWNAAPGEMINDVFAPYRYIGHVEEEDTARCQHAMHVFECLPRLAIGKMLNEAKRQDLVKRTVGKIDFPRRPDDVYSRERIQVIVNIARRWPLTAADFKFSQFH